VDCRLIFALLVVGRAQVPPQQKMKPEDVQKSLSLVAKPQPAPEKYQPGLAAITAKDTLAMLTFVASDSLEGARPAPAVSRPPPSTPPRCSSCGASSLRVICRVPGQLSDVRRPAAGPPNPQQRTYFQDSGQEGDRRTDQITIEEPRAGAVKTHSYQGGVDFVQPYATTAEMITARGLRGLRHHEPSLKWTSSRG